MTIKDNLKNIAVWKRGLFILFFGVVFYIVCCLIWLLALFQFAMKLITGEENKQLLQLGSNLSNYVYQILYYISFNTETRPYPFSPWSGEKAAETKTKPAAPSKAIGADDKPKK